MSDLISRQAAIEAIEFGITYAKKINKETSEVSELFQEGNAELRKAAERVNELPSAEPVRMKGWWRDITASDCSGYDPTLAGYDDPVVGYVCSNCGDGHEKEVMGEVLWNFCPNCGASMSEGEEND